MLELSGKDVKTVTIKWFQRAIMKSLEKWKKIENLSKEIEITKKEPNENYRTEKYNYQIKK